MEITGLHLSNDVFKIEFYNTSSKAFKEMAREKEYLLWVLVKTTGQDKTIRGKSREYFAFFSITRTFHI